MMDMEVNPPSPQDMDLIDILWKQDIDLGAQREVFDSTHRQKEVELQRQQQLEQEKRQLLLREQEKALLAQLQLDEETGEYVPRHAPAAAPPQGAQEAPSAEAMSLDECLQLLAETFQVEETEDSSLPLDVAASSGGVLLPAELPAPRMSPEMEQAWVELLSLPELQPCFSLQMQDSPQTTAFALPSHPEAAPPQNFPFYRHGDGASIGAADFIGTFDLPAPTTAAAPDDPKPADSPLTFGPDSFADMFYPGAKESSDGGELEAGDPVMLDLYSLSPGDPLEQGERGATPDSGVSSHGSSPGKHGGSDSDLEEMDLNPGSAESDYSEMFSLNFQPDGFHRAVPVSGPIGEAELPPDGTMTPHPMAEDGGHADAPFTKDKRRKRPDGRLTRDEQRAEALRIPFTVDMIINRPVEEFNEMMSRHQLNEAQLALVRDIRRRGKNKVAAQNCRKRKMENIVGLESELDALRDERDRLLDERRQNVGSVKKMKQRLSSLYLEVFGLLRDQDGHGFSPAEYSLQQASDGSIFLVPRRKKPVAKRRDRPAPAL